MTPYDILWTTIIENRIIHSPKSSGSKRKTIINNKTTTCDQNVITWTNLSWMIIPYKNHCIETMNVDRIIGKGKLSALLTLITCINDANGAAKNIIVTQQHIIPICFFDCSKLTSYCEYVNAHISMKSITKNCFNIVD